MSRRPKFWIHRSGRFWRGLAILLFLFGAWVLTMFLGSATTYRKSFATGEKFGSLRIGSGGLAGRWTEMRYNDTGRLWSPPRWSFSDGSMPGATIKPEFGRYARDWGYISETHYNLFLPLWIPVLGWVLIWFYRVHRQDKREDMLFGSLPESGDEEATPLIKP